MTIKKAVEELLASEVFKADAREDAKLRVFVSRFRKDAIGNGAAVELLLKYGYTIDVRNGRKVAVKNK